MLFESIGSTQIATPNIVVGIAAASMTLASVISSLSIFAIGRILSNRESKSRDNIRGLEIVRNLAILSCCLIAAAFLFANTILMFSSLYLYDGGASGIARYGIAILCFSVVLICYSLGRYLVFGSVEAVKDLASSVRTDVPVFPLINALSKTSISAYVIALAIMLILSLAMCMGIGYIFGSVQATFFLEWIVIPASLAVALVYLMMNNLGFYTISDRLSRTSAVMYCIVNDRGEVLMRRPVIRTNNRRIRRFIYARYSDRWSNWWIFPRYEYHATQAGSELAVESGGIFVARSVRVAFSADLAEPIEGVMESLNDYFRKIGVDDCEEVSVVVGRLIGSDSGIRAGYSWMYVDKLWESTVVPMHICEVVEHCGSGGIRPLPFEGSFWRVRKRDDEDYPSRSRSGPGA